MTQYNTLNVKLSNSQLDKLGIKNGTEVTLNISSNVIGGSNSETNFPLKLLLTGTQVSRICKTFVNDSSGNIKLSKSQLSKMIQLGGFCFVFNPFWLNYMSDISNANSWTTFTRISKWRSFYF